MLRKRLAMLISIALVGSVGTGCLIRTKPRRGQPVYRKADKHDHKKHKKPKKHKRHDDHRDHRFSDEAPDPY